MKATLNRNFNAIMDQSIVSGIVVLIIVVCQFVKTLSFVPSNAIPLIAVLLGVVVSFAAGGANFTSIFSGVLVGLTAVGLYSGVKATVASN